MMRARLSLIALVACVAPVAGQEPGLFPLRDFMTIEMLAEAEIDRPTIRVGDVARISGGTDRERDRLLQLDLDDVPAKASSSIVSRTLLEYRLRLSGASVSSFRVTGAAKTRVSVTPPELSEAAFIRAAAIALADRLDTTPDRLNVRLASRFDRPLWSAQLGDAVRLEGRVMSRVQANQPTKIEVDVVSNGRIRETVPIYVEMPIAPAGAVVGKESPAFSDLGVKSRTTPLSNAVPGTMPVKMRDRVRLIVRVGPVLVQAVGEAEQDGAPGQMVRVRNIDSGKSVYGRLVDTGVVEVGN